MKKITIVTASFLLYCAGASAQPTAYTVDANAFLGASLEGGNTQLQLVDVDQDGFLDLVSIGDHGSPNINTNQHGVMVYFGDGTGTNFQLSMNGTGFGYGGCAVGDINNDGKQDIAYSCHHSGKLIDAMIGDGTGKNWTAYGTGLNTAGETYGMFGTDLGDVNNDGWLDIASNSFGSGNGVHIYKNNKNGTWSHTAAYGQAGNIQKYVKFGDIDGNGNMDFVVSNDMVAAYFGNGAGTFANLDNGLPVPINGQAYFDVSLGDVDNDGDDDFLFSNWDPAGVRSVNVYTWNKGTQKWDNHSTGLPTSTASWFYATRYADMDMDGYLDVITLNYDTKALEIYKGNGGTSWTLTKSIPFPNTYWAQVPDMAINDVNHSGYPDIALMYSSTVSANTLVLIKDDVVPTDLNAALTYPKGGECWPNNAVRFINWVTGVAGNHSSKVKIEYSTAGNTGPWTLIAATAPNNGIFQWNVPAAVNSSTCFIRVTATDNVTSQTAVTLNANPFNIGCNTSTTGINEAEVSSVSVFPNPMSASATISSEWTNCSIRITDVTGNTVKIVSEVAQFPYTIEKGNMASGVYMLELSSGDKVERRKLVIE